MGKTLVIEQAGKEEKYLPWNGQTKDELNLRSFDIELLEEGVTLFAKDLAMYLEEEENEAIGS